MTFADYCDGIQHIGIPTADFAASKAFYTKLGFTCPFETVLNDVQHVMFLQLGSLMLEVYEDETAKTAGAINHYAINCQNIQAAYEKAVAEGYTILSNGIESLPFWENGVSFFIIEGPDKERIEFNQRF